MNNIFTQEDVQALNTFLKEKDFNIEIALKNNNDPNTQYENKYLGEWNTSKDVDEFFKKYTPDNGWNGLKLGNRIKINDGWYNKEWMIAGFNCETGVDGDSAGIALIPNKCHLEIHPWSCNCNNDDKNLNYYLSDIRWRLRNFIKPMLYNVLNDHIIMREVKLIYPNDDKTIEMVKESDFLTLLTPIQLGIEKINTTRDLTEENGEANYKLPLFNFITNYNVYIWLRNVYGDEALHVDSGGLVSYTYAGEMLGIRPLMYLR